MLNYRKAEIKDIDDLIDLRISFLKEAQKGYALANDIELKKSLKDYFINNMKTNNFISWVCTENNKIIATSGICFYTLPPSYKNVTGKIAYIMNMYTLKNYRRKGIAKKLFEKIIEEAKENGCKKLCLHATSDGKPLYEKYGFKLTEDEMILTL